VQGVVVGDDVAGCGETSQGRSVPSGGCGLAVCPGGVFVVGAVVAEAAVQDADEPVSQGAQGLVVQVAGERLRVDVLTKAIPCDAGKRSSSASLRIRLW
jgi:hypothetical protein